MTELVSMLVPLQGTLPGWPEAEAPSLLQVLGLLVGLPLAIFVVIALLGKAGQLIRVGRGETQAEPGEPVWLGALPVDRSAGEADAGAVTGEGRRAIAASDSRVGGASVRW